MFGFATRWDPVTGNRVVSVARMVDDTVRLLESLRDRFGGKTFVAGFSFGATFAAYAAPRPDASAWRASLCRLRA